MVLGYLPAKQKLGGDMTISHDKAAAAVQEIADAMGLSLEAAAEGIVKIVNENMFGALRLVSVEKGYDPRNFSLIAFGGAGPLHANALGKLTQSWPVIVPPGPGVLCAYGDATTRLRDEASRTLITKLDDVEPSTIAQELKQLEGLARQAMLAEGAGDASAQVTDADITAQFQVDLRYSGQGLVLTVDTSEHDLLSVGFAEVAEAFDRLHEQLFTFALDADKEFVNLRVVVEGPEAHVAASEFEAGGADPAAAALGEHEIYADGQTHAGTLYDRTLLVPGNVVSGPAVIMEMDSTTLILPGHRAEVDRFGNLLIRPDGRID